MYISDEAACVFRTRALALAADFDFDLSLGRVLDLDLLTAMKAPQGFVQGLAQGYRDMAGVLDERSGCARKLACVCTRTDGLCDMDVGNPWIEPRAGRDILPKPRHTMATAL